MQVQFSGTGIVPSAVGRAMRHALEQKVFAGAVLLAGDSQSIYFTGAFGRSQVLPNPLPMAEGTVFDVASLTKPLAAATAVAFLVDEGRLTWTSELGEVLPGEIPEDKAGISLEQLLCHTSGLPAFRPYYRMVQSPDRLPPKNPVAGLAASEALAHPPGSRVVYSDVGYLLLGRVVEKTAGEPLDSWIARKLYGPLGLRDTGFRPCDLPGFEASRYCCSAYCAWRKRFLRGEVHDRNAFAAHGVAGHAGLFSTAADLYVLLRELFLGFHSESDRIGLSAPLIRDLFLRRGPVAGNSFRMGFDTPSPTGSQAGDLFPRNSVGHLGFTGASFWMDLESGFQIILLTNRLLGRPRTAIRSFRPRLHELVQREMGMAR